MNNVLKDKDHLLVMIDRCVDNDDRHGLAGACFGLGKLYQEAGDLDQAEAQYRRSLILSEALKEKGDVAAAYMRIGLLYEVRGDRGQARFYLQESLGIYEKLDDRKGCGEAIGYLGFLDFSEGKIAAAEAQYEQALSYSKETGQLGKQAEHLANLGYLYLTRTESERAMEYFDEALILYQQAGDMRGVGGLYTSLGNMKLSLGEVEAARRYFTQALSIHEAADYATGMGLARSGLCEVALHESELAQAERFGCEALAYYRRAGHKVHTAAAHMRIGVVLAKQRDYERACTEYEHALELYEEMDRAEGVALTCKKLGDIYLQLASEEVDKVEGMYRRALGVYEGLRDEHGRGQAYVGLGKTAVRRGETTQAIAMWSAASELFRNTGYEEQAQQLQGAVRHIWSGGEVQVA